MPSRLEQLRIAVRLRSTLRARGRADRLDEDAGAAWRADRLSALRRHAQARSSHYRERHGDLEDAPLDALPVLTKAELLEHFDDIVTDPRLRQHHLRDLVDADRGDKALGRYRVGATSGSSGRPGLFPFDETEWVALIATAARARAIAGRPAVEGVVRTARIGSPSRWHLSRQLAATLHDPRKPSLTLSAASDPDELVTSLNSWRPQVLTGYPSSLAVLADAQMDGRLRIDPVQVFAGGERMSDEVRQRIRDAWGTDPFDQYLTTEAGFVAIECSHHDGLHILDDHVVVEIVDAGGAAVPPGTFGERVLITVLDSRTLPLIRYELGDVAAFASGMCGCGRRSPRLRSIASGARDLLRLRGRDGGHVLIHPVVVSSLLDPAAVGGWQVVLEDERVRLLVTAPDPALPVAGLGQSLVDALAAAGAAPIPVVVEVVDEIDRTGAGKAAAVISRTSSRPPG